MLKDYLNKSVDLLNEMLERPDEVGMARAVQLSSEALASQRALLLCGNGGSASDAMHITGELVGRFLRERRALKAICLSSNSAVLTAWTNDYSYETVFSRQVEAYGEPGGVLVGLSTSGNSQNVVCAMETARKIGMKTIGFTGQGGGKMGPLSDVLIEVPSQSTPLIQQAHICLYHYFCEEIESAIADC